MIVICIVVGLSLVACGILIAYATKRRKKSAVNAPPPLPPRVNAGIHSPSVSHVRTSINNSSTARTLLPRRSSTTATAAVNRSTVETGYGPRGVKPTQFPCCPFDKQRNVPGERQVIFWNSGAGCYRCSRGHQFKSNGKLL